VTRLPGASRAGATHEALRDRGLASILAGFVVLSALYHASTPPMEASDEAGHVATVLYLKEHRRLPVASRAPEAIIIHQELVQPPLYYALAAAVTAPIDTSDAREFFIRRPDAPIGRADIAGPKHGWVPRGDRTFPYRRTMLAIALMRLLSMLMGLATVVFTYQVARAVEPRDAGTARFAAALVAFNPMFLFIANAVNNDNLAVMLVTGCLVLLLRRPGDPLDLRRCADLGLLAGAAVMAKLSAVIVFPAIALGLLGKLPRGRRLPALLVSGAGALAIGWWWALRNRLLYGDWLGLSAFTRLAGDARAHVQPLALLREWDGFVKSYWGVFGMFNVVFPEPVYWFFYLVTGLGLGSVAWRVLRGRSALPHGLPLLALLSGTNLLAVAYWTAHVWASQGRLMFPSIGSTAVLFAAGLGVLGKRARTRVAVLVSTLLASLAAYGALVLIPSQYR
jgi:hypothetical protein